MIVNDFELANIALFLHDFKKPDNNFGDWFYDNLFLAFFLSIHNSFEAVSQHIHFYHSLIFQLILNYSYQIFNLTSDHLFTISTDQLTPIKVLSQLINLPDQQPYFQNNWYRRQKFRFMAEKPTRERSDPTGQLDQKIYYMHQVADVENYENYHKFRFIGSAPCRYLITLLTIVINMCLFYVFSIRAQNWYITLVVAILNFFTLVFMILLALVDPGIIPKILSRFESTNKDQIPIPQQYLNHQIQSYEPKVYSIVIKTHQLQLKFCSSCFIFRPPHASHCYQCNACIQRFDHHCVFIGNCIGKNNYKYFFYYVLCLALMLLCVFVQIIITLIEINRQEQLGRFIINIILIIQVFLGLGLVLGLLGFHTFLIKNNTTTNQFCKKAWNSLAGNPKKKKSCWKNLLKALSYSIIKANPNEQLKLRKQKFTESRIHTDGPSERNNRLQCVHEIELVTKGDNTNNIK